MHPPQKKDYQYWINYLYKSQEMVKNAFQSVKT